MNEYLIWLVGICVILAEVVLVAIMLRKSKITPDVGREISDRVIDLVRQAEVKWQEYDRAGAEKKAWVMEQLRATFEFVANTGTIGKLVDSMVAVFNALDLW